MLNVKLLDVCINIVFEKPEELLNSIKSDFSRRYLPPVTYVDKCTDVLATIYWLKGESFRVISTKYSENDSDIYVVEGGLPAPYTNESPIFFLLQVLARSLVRKGYVVLTDSVVLGSANKTLLLLGFPHTGKSTIASIAFSHGLNVYSTENTIVKIENERIKFITGTRVLVYDPIVKKLYGVNPPSTGRTKHGYEILDLENWLKISYNRDIVVDEIYVIYTSFSSTGVSIVPVKGRKIDKLLWYFATTLIKGLDYYYPHPLDIPMGKEIREVIIDFIVKVRNVYREKFYEVFGSPLEVLKAIIR